MLSPCNVVVIVMLIVVFYSDPPPQVLSLSSRRHSSGEGLGGVLAVVMLIVVFFYSDPPPVSCRCHLSSRHCLLGGLGMDGVRSCRCSMSSFLFDVVESRRRDLAAVRREKKWTASSGEGLDGVVVV